MAKTTKIIVCDAMGERKQISVDANRYAQLMQYREAFAQHVIGAEISNMRFSDAAEAGAFMINQLAYVEEEVYDVQIVPLQYAELMTVTAEAGPQATQIVYQIKDRSGQFRRLSPGANDLPSVEVGYADVTLNVAHGGGKYEYTTQELRESAWLRRPISIAKAEAAKEAEQIHVNNVALVGESASNFTGLLNNPNVPTGNAPVGSWGGGSTTEVQCVSDLSSGIYNVYANSAFNDFPTTILVSPTVMNYLTRAFIGTNAFVSLLEFILKNNMAKAQKKIELNFIAVPQLETIGAGGTRRTVFYPNNTRRVKFHYPMPWRVLAPQFRDLKVIFPGEYRYGATQVTYPKSFYYMDGC